MLIDIQSKMKEGKGEGYRNWATGFNLQQMSKTLIYLSENGLKNYDDLVKETNTVTGGYNRRLTRIKEIETRLGEISELQKQIGVYGKTREIYQQYRATGKDVNFYEQFRKDLALHETAKRHFDSLGLKKLPSLNWKSAHTSERSRQHKNATPKNRLWRFYCPVGIVSFVLPPPFPLP